MHTGPVRRELRKLAGSPDASHWTHPERPVLTGLMRREGRQTAHTPYAEHRTHSGASGALCTPTPQTDTTPDALDQRPVLPTPASGECFSVRNTLATSLNSHWRNRKYTLNFLKSVESRRALNPRNSTSFANVPTPSSVNHHVQMC